MQPQNLPIIAHDSTSRRSAWTRPTATRPHARVAVVLGALGLVVGLGAAVHYWSAGMAISHYDARAHLVVARRILDSLTPGWNQIGAVWLPLPHVLNALPVQIDAFYRTGASAIAISVVSLAAGIWALSRYVLAATASRAAAVVCAAAVLLSPDLLYLSSTPMTEPLLIGLSAMALWLVADSLEHPELPVPRHLAGAALAAACLVRYEAWPVSVALLGLSVVARWRAGLGARATARQVATIAAYPLGAVLLFLALSHATTGEWFVTSGFYVPETLTRHRPIRSLVAVWWGAHHLTGYPTAILGTAGLAIAAILAVVDAPERRKPALMLAAAMAAAALLPAYAFYAGHPFRFRYMVPLVPAAALGLGLAVGVAGRWRALVAAGALVVMLWGPRPFDVDAPVLRESRLDRDNSDGRRAVTAYLAERWDGEPVLASMGALAHYMHELSAIGFGIRDFVHEGNGDLWEAAVAFPARQVRWVIVEEAAEGGDLFARKACADAAYLAGFERVAEGGHVALFRRAALGQVPRIACGTPTTR